MSPSQLLADMAVPRMPGETRRYQIADPGKPGESLGLRAHPHTHSGDFRKPLVISAPLRLSDD